MERSIDEFFLDDDMLIQDTISNYQFFKGLTNRTIIINNTIDEDIVERAVIPLKNFEEEDPEKEIRIYLNSPGGNLIDGFALISQIERCTAPITIEILGNAASMACLIAMAGYRKDNVKTTCGKYSVGLIHSGFQAVSGTAHSVEDTMNFNKRYEDIVKEYVVTHSNISRDLYDEIYRKEFWMTAEDMKKYGIVDEII